MHRLEITDCWKPHVKHVAEASCVRIGPIKRMFYSVSYDVSFQGGFRP
jgi:hypothetical protein